MKKATTPPKKGAKAVITPKKKVLTPKAIILISVALILVISLAVVVPLMLLGGKTYLTVGGEKVSYDMVRCTVKQYMSIYTEEELKDEAVRQEIRDMVYEDLRLRYVVYTVAKEQGVSLTSSQKREIREQMKAYRALDDYKEMLDAMYATDSVMEDLLYIDALDTALYDMLEINGTLKTDNETIDADLATDRWYAAEYAILEYDKSNKDERKKELEAALDGMGASLKTALTDLSKRYKSDFLFATDGCFTDTIYSDDFEATVKALEVGEVSEIVDTVTASGYACFMVMRRTAIEDKYVDENYDTIVAYYLAREYAEMMTERAEGLEIVIADKYKEFDILDIE